MWPCRPGRVSTSLVRNGRGRLLPGRGMLFSLPFGVASSNFPWEKYGVQDWIIPRGVLRCFGPFLVRLNGKALS